MLYNCILSCCLKHTVQQNVSESYNIFHILRNFSYNYRTICLNVILPCQSVWVWTTVIHCFLSYHFLSILPDIWKKSYFSRFFPEMIS